MSVLRHFQHTPRALSAKGLMSAYEIRKSPHPRSKEMTEAVAKRWGSLSGFKAAEVFEVILSRTSDFKSLSF